MPEDSAPAHAGARVRSGTANPAGARSRSPPSASFFPSSPSCRGAGGRGRSSLGGDARAPITQGLSGPRQLRPPSRRRPQPEPRQGETRAGSYGPGGGAQPRGPECGDSGLRWKAHLGPPHSLRGDPMQMAIQQLLGSSPLIGSSLPITTLKVLNTPLFIH